MSLLCPETNAELAGLLAMLSKANVSRYKKDCSFIEIEFAKPDPKLEFVRNMKELPLVDKDGRELTEEQKKAIEEQDAEALLFHSAG